MRHDCSGVLFFYFSILGTTRRWRDEELGFLRYDCCRLDVALKRLHQLEKRIRIFFYSLWIFLGFIDLDLIDLFAEKPYYCTVWAFRRASDKWERDSTGESEKLRSWVRALQFSTIKYRVGTLVPKMSYRLEWECFRASERVRVAQCESRHSATAVKTLASWS